MSSPAAADASAAAAAPPAPTPASAGGAIATDDTGRRTKRKMNAGEDDHAAAAAEDADAARYAVEAGSETCRFDRCCLPTIADGLWCSQHARIMRAGEAIMADAYNRYEGEDGIWDAIRSESNALRAEALFAVHAFVTKDPVGQVPMGNCRVCSTFQLSLWTATDAMDREMLACWSCLKKSVAAHPRHDCESDADSD